MEGGCDDSRQDLEDDEEDEAAIATEEELSDEEVTRATGAGKVALKRAATLGTLGRPGQEETAGDKRAITNSLWSFLSYLMS